MRYTYPVVFNRNELGGYSVWFPDLPECYTDGDDFDDAINMAAEAMSLVIESYISAGRQPPDPSFSCCLSDGAVLVSVSCNVVAGGEQAKAHAAGELRGDA